MPDWIPNDDQFPGNINEGFKLRPPSEAIYFVDDPKIAQSYAFDKGAWDYQNAIPRILKRNIQLQNPKIIDAKGEDWRETKDEIKKAKEEGHDGIVIKNVVDPYSRLEGKGKRYAKPATNIIVFSPDNIERIKV
jgi:hypothetical protein